jgi:bacteriorhodopsin
VLRGLLLELSTGQPVTELFLIPDAPVGMVAIDSLLAAAGARGKVQKFQFYISSFQFHILIFHEISLPSLASASQDLVSF